MNIDNDLRNELLNFKINGKFDVIPYTIYTNLIMYAKFENGNVNGIELQRGQCLSSIPRLCDKTGLTEKNVRTAIKKLIDAGYIKKDATKHYTIFTVCHYDKKSNADAQNKQEKKIKANHNADSEQSIHESKERRLQALREKAIAGTLTPEEAEEFNNWRR